MSRDLPHTPSTAEVLFRKTGEIIRIYAKKICETQARFFIKKKERNYGAKVIVGFRTSAPAKRRHFVQKSTFYIKSDFDLDHLECFLSATTDIYRT